MSAHSPFTPAQSDDLRAMAAMIIPTSAEFDVPGADDKSIQADIVATLGRDAELVREALDELARLTGRRPLGSLVRALGLEPRPPYPKGHVLEDGDWSLLDPVRARPPMWRRA